VLRRISGPKREKVVRCWRRLHNEELHNLYASPNIRVVISSGIRLVGHVTDMGEMRNVYKILIRKPEGKIRHGRPRCSWGMDTREIG